jgi:hypothetical protein
MELAGRRLLIMVGALVMLVPAPAGAQAFSWSAPTSLPLEYTTELNPTFACASDRQCTVTIGINELTFDPQDPGSPKPVSLAQQPGGDGEAAEPASLSCPSTTLCVATDGYTEDFGPDGYAFTFDPQTGVAQAPVSMPAGAGLVSCPSTAECVSIDSNAGDNDPDDAFEWDPATPTMQRDIDLGFTANTPFDALACPAENQCSVTNDSYVSTFNPLTDVSVTPFHADLSDQTVAQPFACASTSLCVTNRNNSIDGCGSDYCPPGSGPAFSAGTRTFDPSAPTALSSSFSPAPSGLPGSPDLLACPLNPAASANCLIAGAIYDSTVPSSYWLASIPADSTNADATPETPPQSANSAFIALACPTTLECVALGVPESSGAPQDADFEMWSTQTTTSTPPGGPSGGNPGGSSGGNPGGKSGGGDSVSTVGRAVASGSTVLIPISCSSGSSSCKVTSTLSVTETLRGSKVVAVASLASKKRTHRRTITVGRATVTVTAGRKTTERVQLNKTGRQLLATHHKLSVELTVTRTGDGKATRLLHRSVSLRRTR